MDNERATPPARTGRRVAAAAGLLAAGALAGGVLAGTLSASAEDGGSPAATYGAANPGTPGGQLGGGARGGPDPVRSDETRLSGSDAAAAKAAALKAVPGGTVYRVETDAGDAAYEVHMTKADGTLVTVKLETSMAVVTVQDGMGKGDPAQDGGSRAGTGRVGA